MHQTSLIAGWRRRPHLASIDLALPTQTSEIGTLASPELEILNRREETVSVRRRASGALVSIFNAESKFGTVEDYKKYTRPYDQRVFDALADTKLTVLHLHYLKRPYLDQFKDFNAPVLQYSMKTSGIPISEVRRKYSQPILGGVDEIDYRKLTTEEIRSQWQDARSQAGAKYVAAPGCSIPNDSSSDELARFPRSFGI